MHGTQLGLALVAGGQTDRMQFSFYHDGGYYHVETQRLRLVKQAAQEEKGLRAAPVFGGQHRCYYKGRKAAARAGGTGCSGPCERFPVPGVEEA